MLSALYKHEAGLFFTPHACTFCELPHQARWRSHLTQRTRVCLLHALVLRCSRTGSNLAPGTHRALLLFDDSPVQLPGRIQPVPHAFLSFLSLGIPIPSFECDVTIAASTCKLSSRSSRAPLAYSPLLTQATLGTTLSTYTTPCSPILPSHPCPFPTGWYLVGVAGVRAAFNRLGHTQHKQAKAAGHALQKKKSAPS